MVARTSPLVGGPYLIRCRSRRHQVAIDPRRFWQPARCPVCKTAVDAWRVRRLLWWLNGRGPVSRFRLPVLGEFSWVEIGLLFWLVVLLMVAGTMWWAGDSWWVGTVLLFAGRWIWAVPLLPLCLLALPSFRKRSLFLGVANVALALGPIMGLSLGLGRLTGAPKQPGNGVRLISYNMGSRQVTAFGLVTLLKDWEPDLLAIQECGTAAAEAMRLIEGYQLHSSSVCLISRWPLDSVAIQPRRDIEEVGGSGQVVRYRVRAPFGVFDVTNLHLETPREGLAALRYADRSAGSVIDKEIILRNIESSRARQWVDQGEGPRLVAGDFNTPGESVIFRNHWGDLTDAFARAGFGFGYTKFTTFIGVRIDHILADERWIVRRSRVLPDYGSDHRPVLAELELRPPTE